MAVASNRTVLVTKEARLFYEMLCRDDRFKDCPECELLGKIEGQIKDERHVLMPRIFVAVVSGSVRRCELIYDGVAHEIVEPANTFFARMTEKSLRMARFDLSRLRLTFDQEALSRIDHVMSDPEQVSRVIDVARKISDLEKGMPYEYTDPEIQSLKEHLKSALTGK